MQEPYQPIIDDGRGIFPRDFRVKAPRGFNDAVRLDAQRQRMARAECTPSIAWELRSRRGASAARFC